MRRMDLEFMMQCISGRKMAAAAMVGGIASQQSQYFQVLSSSTDETTKANANNALKMLEANMTSINAWDTTLEVQMKKIETQHTAVVAEEESVKKLVENNTKSFKYFASA
jgi:hypothetical protein